MKKPLLAVFLVWLAGPIGLMYVNKRKFWPAFFEYIGVIILGIITSGFALLVAQIIYMVIAYTEAKKINNALAGTESEIFSQPASAFEPMLTNEAKENLCPNCAQEVPDHAHFCPACGQKLANYCPNCKKLTQASALYCGFCGTKLDGNH
ncbi:MAG: zinc ribbon domain-containing protein [Firmicutes bacterium]|nr:zinc ribbon domain-containing protein [Bacillota bacterium]